jgi:hypothetical protein
MRRCRHCGCSEPNPCVDRESGALCAWFDKNTCTFCADPELIALVVGARLAHDLAMTIPDYTPLDHKRAAAWYAEACA